LLRGGRRLFSYERNGDLVNLSSRLLNAYIRQQVGEDYSAKVPTRSASSRP